MRQDSLRLAELRKQLILDSSVESAYDDIARLLATSLDVPITLINFLDRDRDWFKSAVGISQQESPVQTSFCETFLNTAVDVLVVDDTTSDWRFAAHPLVIGEPYIRFYAAARLTSSGHTLGTLCAYDVKPRRISEAQMATLKTLASAVMELLGKRASTVGAS